MRKKRWWRLSLMAAGGIAAVGVFAVLLPGCLELATQAALLPRTERRIGAEIRAPWVNAGGEMQEVITFVNVAPGGACAQAGVVSGDIIVSDPTIGALCKRLDQPSGQEIVVEVVAGGAGPPIDQRPRRLIVIVFP